MRARHSNHYGLTFNELAIGVFCVSVLVCLLIVWNAAAKAASRKLHAKGMLNQIVVAVGAYRSEYGEWPPLQKSAPSNIRPTSDDWIGDPEMGAWLHNNVIFTTLWSIPEGPNENHAANPRKIVFLVGQQARFTDDGGPVDGFFDSDSTGKSAPSEVKGCLYDPWGREYHL